MRVVILALMIVLLPLRGWVGDVMALERIAPDQATAMVDCEHTHAHPGQGETTHADGVQTSGHGAAHASGDCGGCTACQICHTVALAGLPALNLATQLPMALPQTQTWLHASAEPAPGFKPPIS